MGQRLEKVYRHMYYLETTGFYTTLGGTINIDQVKHTDPKSRSHNVGDYDLYPSH